MYKFNSFYAFPSKPERIKETILDAVKTINKKNIVNITPWTDLNPGGKVVITQILNRIKKCDLFLADLTGMNPNVFFELGFAIACNKRIWLTIDDNDYDNIEQIISSKIIAGIGFHKYINDDQIVSSFFKEKPFNTLDETILSDYEGMVSELDDNFENNDILYFKSPVEHTASKKLTKFLASLNRKIITNDDNENSYLPLKTVISDILRSKIAIVHLLSNKHENHMEKNAIFSFYAGLSIGLERKVLLLAPEPYSSPLDYRDILFIHSTGNECVESTKNWLYPILSTIEPKQIKQKPEAESELILLKFVLGDGQAEHEENDIDNYFIETSQYNIGKSAHTAVFIGRKGTGKTANLIKIKEFFLSEKKNLVITIKPMSFKLETFVKLVENYFSDLDIQSAFTERIWEFVIHTSIIEECVQSIIAKPQYYDRSNDDLEILDYYEKNQEIINADFGEKLTNIYDWTESLVKSGNYPKKILELIFSKYLTELIEINKLCICNYNRLIILVDNLDKAWDFGRDVEIQCKIIFGLFGIYNTINRDLKWKKGDSRLLIFLREDIFQNVKKLAREPDKILLNTHRLLWDDNDLLFKVIEERFISFDQTLTYETVWSELFCEMVNNIPIKDYISKNIIPRPRDLIYFTQQAINECINHRHRLIEANDLFSAQLTYYEFLLENTVTEYKLYFRKVRELINSFYRSEQIFNINHLKKKLKPFYCKGWEFDRIVEFMINISFIGIFEEGNVDFSYSDSDTEKLIQYLKAKKSYFSKLKLIIHPAFYIGLDKQLKKI